MEASTHKEDAVSSQSFANGEVYESDGSDASSFSQGGDYRRVRFRTRSPETEMASLVSRALVGDLQLGVTTTAANATATVTAGTDSATVSATGDRKEKEKKCCICGSAAVYTCPGCGRRTCSLTCVRVHRTDHGCTGVRDIAQPVSLKDYSDAHLQRDFRFLEDCRRVVSNAGRQLPPARRFNFRALPPPLRTLREAARKRGVVCQLISEGMAKREANTSRYDRSTNTIVWRCAFTFHRSDGDKFTIETSWGSERHRLGDILAYCWSTNPALPCYHINQRYNRAAEYLGAETGGTASAAATHTEGEGGEVKGDAYDAERAESDQAASEVEEEARNDGAEWSTVAPDDASEVVDPTVAQACGSDAADDEELEAVGGEAEPQLPPPPLAEVPEPIAEAVGPAQDPPLPVVHPISPEEVRNQALVADFLAGDSMGWAVLAKAERLGTVCRYFRLEPRSTLNENLRSLFFINEYPAFEVVHTADLHQFPLVTGADRERIRASFRAQERTPEELLKRAYPGIRLKSDMNPEEVERLRGVPCRRHLTGNCAAGENCPYWHCTLEEWPQCRTFQKTGRCPLGYRCSFRHGDRLPGEEQAAAITAGVGPDGRRPRPGCRGWMGGRGRGRGGRRRQS